MHERLSQHLRERLDNQFAADWARQRRTAEDVLGRLQTQEGVVLADQVGMGKTYVALAVATSHILRTQPLSQVVVFVPARVAEKWINEWGKFHEALLADGAPEIRCVKHPIRSGEDFLKSLDDPPKTRNHLIIVTHQALTTTLKDSFIQLALLYYAIRNRNEASTMRNRIAKWSDGAKGLVRDRRFNPIRIQGLLAAPPDQWHEVWQSMTGEDLGDAPVPGHLQAVAQEINLDAILAAVRALPINYSQGAESRLKVARTVLNDATQAVWKQILTTPPKPRLPLLIIDEAHALKNDGTRISRLFSPLPGEPEDGALRGIFDRILLLTATPFELGHSELISVLRRLDAIRPMRPRPIESLEARLQRLGDALRLAQETALCLNDSWARLSPDDFSAFDSWSPDLEPPAHLTHAACCAWRDARYAAQARKAMHANLRPWVIRHERARRRDYLPGSAILPGSEAQTAIGLEVPESAALPFLLAARAQSVAALQRNGAARPLFAYGIASSYEAFLRLDTTERALDSDLQPEEESDSSDASIIHLATGTPAQWYHHEISVLLSTGSQREQHPKVTATADRAVSLWLSGQKCLIFCWYIRTTKALLDAIQGRLAAIMQDRASKALDCSLSEVDARLDRISDHLLKADSASHKYISERLLQDFLVAANGNAELAEAATWVAVRNLRTTAFLVRYTHLSSDLDADGLLEGIRGKNPAGVNLLARWMGFVTRMSAVTNDERTRVLANLQGDRSAQDDEKTSSIGKRGASLDQVRRAYGGTRREDRERLISVFNTPFAPDILIASSVMGEGIDLHQECRHVIHHDLDWNPSKLEQRTGRLDRIGALAERECANIQVFEPYLAGTHDEKMFRVVKDRAGWFDVVMGQATNTDEHVTDQEESRIELHPSIRDALSMNLQSS